MLIGLQLPILSIPFIMNRLIQFLAIMKNLYLLSLSILLLLNIGVLCEALAQSSTKSYTYESVPDDPLNVRIYTLENGLTVYMSVNKNEPRFHGRIVVRAGSTSDPSDATGLAHYLEHMLFKGTDRFGTINYEAEKVELDKIEALYDAYSSTQDTAKRKAIYHQIDSVSGVAAQYAIPNEYDKIIAGLGGRLVNASVSTEYTNYYSDLPSNQLGNWLKLEAERFRNPIMRIFHTELEAVYEEKNLSLDNDVRQLREALYAALFAKHNYGQQTTIGTIEHLKNPSLQKIKEYFEHYYVPNNMAICFAGDIDPDQTIALVDQYFGQWASSPVSHPRFSPENNISTPIIREVYGPEEEQLMIGFRFPEFKSQTTPILRMVDMILANSSAGLIDINLNQQQKLQKGNSFLRLMNDYSMHILEATPKDEQSLEKVKELLLGQIELVKSGNFDEALMEAIVNDFEVREMKESENNERRTRKMMDTFIFQENWKNEVNKFEKLRELTKEEVVKFAQKYYQDNYVVAYKRKGERPKVEVAKPPITPVQLNRDAQSDFAKSLIEAIPKATEPVFLDYQQDVQKLQLSKGTQIIYAQNRENELFELYYLFDWGTNEDRELAIALDYLQYVGTKDKTPEEVKFAFYALGTQFKTSITEHRTYLSISGLRKNMEASIELLERLIQHAQADQEILDKRIESLLTNRANLKLNKQQILFMGMVNYAMYGPENPFNQVLSEPELKALTAKYLVKKIRNLRKYKHRIFYYGPDDLSTLKTTLNELHPTTSKPKDTPDTNSFKFQSFDQNRIYFVDYDMVQAEVMWLSKSVNYDTELQPIVEVFNNYFGGGMESLIFQHIRESKALAYNTFARFANPRRKEEPYFFFTYVGTQVDKLPEAMHAMNELIDNMPVEQSGFQLAKTNVQQRIETERITRMNILFNYNNALLKGVDTDIRKYIYEQLPLMGSKDVKAFQETYLKEKPHTILILADRKKIDMSALQHYGDVVELRLEEIFGY